MKIAIVGGGTAGFVSALIIKTTFPNFHVEVIRSTNIPTIGVGEGSTEHWTRFMDYCGIVAGDMVKECDATFKSGIMFQNWGGRDYLQNVHGPFEVNQNGLPIAYSKLMSEDVDPKELTGKYLWENKTPFMKFIEERPNETGVSQYHFNTMKLNDFLTKKAKEKGCVVIDDEIVDVKHDTNITSLVGKKQIYEHDFYIDCTGFKRLLINKLGAHWKSYGNFLKMKEAIVFPTAEEEEIPIWTLARAMDYGWMFRIPVWGRKGNGYIFDSDYITADQAKLEVEKYLGWDISIAKTIKFDPGALTKPWIGNCCAIGLSANFVEPLEASSIGTSIQQAFLLCNRIINYNPASVARYNTEINAIMDNIRDFIALHYISNRRDTEFWQDVSQIELPNSLHSNLQMWKHRLPIADDFSDTSKKLLFNEYNHALVLHGMDIFNRESLQKQYQHIAPEVKQHIEIVIKEKNDFDTVKAVPHKTMIDLLRSLV
ncbi:MAG: hypothetical protein CMA64_06420 [Euryarchaeota archaeon]|nr:hypothetical protein [Euryarchaeota archaeon]